MPSRVTGSRGFVSLTQVVESGSLSHISLAMATESAREGVG